MVEEDKQVEERTKEVFNFLKGKATWITYIILALIVFISTWIRTRNLPLLKDVTTGGWTLGPDLDPFLFLRWAKEIVATGTLASIDYLRNVPVGFKTNEEVLLHPYMVAWFHKIWSAIGLSSSIEYSTVIYPVFMFAITIIAFFFLVRKIFLEKLGIGKSNAIALIASFFLSVIPSILPRTIAGIPEKEASGFFFLFLALYLFIFAWKSDKKWKKITFGIISGLTTAAMALVWGGFIFIILTISLSLLFAMLLDKIGKDELYLSIGWLIAFMTSGIYSTRYTPINLLHSTTTLITIMTILLISFNFILFNTRLKKYFETPMFSKIPKPLISIIVAIVLGILFLTVTEGPGFIIDKAQDVIKPMITPTTDRLGLTVAENKQPYFDEWASSFGPYLGSVPIFFWLFFIGSIFLYSRMMQILDKKERVYATLGYAFFLFAIVFSRYAQNSTLNGTNFISLSLYALGILAVVGTFGWYWHKHYVSGNHEKFKSLDFGIILLFSLFFLSIISARGAVRLVMMLVPSTSIIVGYLVVESSSSALNSKESSMKLLIWAVAIIVLISTIFSGYYFYQSSIATSEGYAPNSYTQQWQRAMEWVRDSTPQDAVFGHWWDYGYWLQSIGNRATVIDGGNSIPYWNHLMGRYTLTGRDDKQAIDFLYPHNVTYFLIDSSDIGKYGAFSSIGSDENYDRRSYIGQFSKDPRQTQEKKNSTLYVYQGGGIPLDEDIVYSINGTKIFLPGNSAAIIGVLIEEDSSGNLISQPQGVFYYQQKQIIIPLRYAFSTQSKSGLVDFNSGLEAGVFLFPKATQQGNTGGVQVEREGSLLYLSNRTVLSQVARLYLYKQDNQYFKLAHSEDDVVVSILKSQDPGIGDFVDFQGLRGPIRIWNIKYPAGMVSNPDYILTDFPDKRLAY